MRQYMTEEGDLYIPLHPLTLERIKDTLAYTDSDSTPEPELFDVAQAEAVALLQLLCFPDYMRQRHGIQNRAEYQSPSKLALAGEMSIAEEHMLITDSPMSRALLAMLSNPGERLKLEAVVEEVDPQAAAALAFVMAVEHFRVQEPEALPHEAHDMVEKFMTGDSGLQVSFSQKVQQELISTPRPHIQMFDPAQKEALRSLLRSVCPDGPYIVGVSDFAAMSTL